MEEIYKPIPNFSNYLISNYGNIKNNKTNKTNNILRGSGDKHSYIFHVLVDNNSNRKTIACHRIVAQVFIPNSENKSQVNHKNKNRKDNRLQNLEWVTPSENVLHAISTGLINNKDRYKHKREVYQLDLDGKIINKFHSITETQEYFKKKIEVSTICKNYRKSIYSTCKGYM